MRIKGWDWALVLLILGLAFGAFEPLTSAAREEPLYHEPEMELIHRGSEVEFQLFMGGGPNRVLLTFCMHPNPPAAIEKWKVHIVSALDAPEPLPALRKP